MKLTVKYFESLDLALRMGNRSFARKTVLKLLDHINEIEQEKWLLLQQIEREAEAQKPVTIPLHVAEAIEFFRSSGIHETIILGIMYGVYFEDDGIHASALVKYRESRGGMNIANALVNSYTLETVESKIKAAVLKLVEERSERNIGYIVANDCKEFSREVTEVVTQIIREDQAGQ